MGGSYQRNNEGFPGGASDKESAHKRHWYKGLSSAVGNGKSFQYFCLGNSMDRGAWLTTVHKVTESDTTKET